MKRISDELFLGMKPDMDKVFAIRVKKEDFYFLGWMENAEDYKIQMAVSPEESLLSRDYLIGDGDLYEAVVNCDGYNNMETLAEGDVSDEEAYQKFLSLIQCYTRNGVSDVGDHDIFIMTENDISNFLDLFRDGEYIIVLEDAEEARFKSGQRKVQFYEDGDRYWQYIAEGVRCECECNVFHLEYDGKTIYGTCNACNADVYEILPEAIHERLGKGIWKWKE